MTLGRPRPWEGAQVWGQKSWEGALKRGWSCHIVLWEMPKDQLGWCKIFFEAWVAGAVIWGTRRRQFIIKGVSHKFKGATDEFKPGCEGALWRP